MKNIVTFCLLLVFSSITSTAQEYSKGSIELSDHTLLEGNVRLDYTTNRVFYKKKYREQSFSFDLVKNVRINKVLLSKLIIYKDTYFGNEMVRGRASLYQINKNTYLILKEDGVSRTIDLTKDQKIAPGVLAYLFNDCNAIRSTLNTINKYTETSLSSSVQTYNSCNYEPFALTKSEIQNAIEFNSDIAHLYVGLSGALTSIGFSDDPNSQSAEGFQAQIGVVGTPTFFGRWKGNLYFAAEAQGVFSKNTNFSNADRDLDFSINSYRLLLGMQYVFNKKGLLKPFVGFSGGVTAGFYNGSRNNDNFDFETGNVVGVPTLGFKYALPNQQHLGVVISYFTEYDSDFFFRAEQQLIPLSIDIQTITIGINYYF